MTESAPPPTDGWQPTDLGLEGRRAQAWFLTEGIAVSATDANVAGHALAVVLEALKLTNRPFAPHKLAWVKELIAEYADEPNALCTEFEHRRGQTEVDIAVAAVGYGYVRPRPNGAHECGGALFTPATRHVTPFEPHDVQIVSAADDVTD